MMTKKERKEGIIGKNFSFNKIGSVIVDSGELLIIDPCIRNLWREDGTKKDLAVSSATAWGDGAYDVYRPMLDNYESVYNKASQLGET